MLDLLLKRRSIRKYKTTPVEQEKVDKLIKAALLAPSSKGMKPWEFIVLEDKDTLNKLSKSKSHGSAFLSGAPLGIVVIADTTKNDVCIEDTSIASIIIQLQAETMGLGSCWIQIRNRMHDDKVTAEEYIKGVLGIQENYSVQTIISIGYPDESKRAYEESELKYDKIHREKF